jgi:hypothetical protein
MTDLDDRPSVGNASDDAASDDDASDDEPIGDNGVVDVDATDGNATDNRCDHRCPDGDRRGSPRPGTVATHRRQPARTAQRRRHRVDRDRGDHLGWTRRRRGPRRRRGL